MDNLGSVYNWISSLPPLSEWDVSMRSFDFQVTFFSMQLIVRREHFEGVTVYLKFLEMYVIPEYCGSLGYFMEDHPKVISSLLFNYFHAFISFMLSRFEKDGYNLQHNDLPSPEELLIASDVDSGVTQKPSYPLVFDSLLLYICSLLRPSILRSDKTYSQVTSTDVLLATNSQLKTLYLDFLRSLYYPKLSSLLPLFSSNLVSISKFWKICIQRPVISFESTPDKTPDSLARILYSQQFKCTVQLKHHVDIIDDSIQAQVHVDNVRCDVFPFKILPNPGEKNSIWKERYFPSKIVISVVPQCQNNEMILSLSHFTHNAAVQTTTGQGLDLEFRPPKDVGIKGSSTTSSSQTVSFWKFVQTAEEPNGSFKWILNDPLSGVEVINSKPRKKIFIKSDPNTWYNKRYTKACGPFHDEGGVVFAADEYGRTLTWTMDRDMKGKTLKLKVEGSIWLTYWPNLHNTSFYHTVKHDFCEEVELQLTES